MCIRSGVFVLIYSSQFSCLGVSRVFCFYSKIPQTDSLQRERMHLLRPLYKISFVSSFFVSCLVLVSLSCAKMGPCLCQQWTWSTAKWSHWEAFLWLHWSLVQMQYLLFGREAYARACQIRTEILQILFKEKIRYLFCEAYIPSTP